MCAAWWQFWRGNEGGRDDDIDVDGCAGGGGGDGSGRDKKRGGGNASKETENNMRDTARMMEEHRRFQDASERTSTIMDELSSAIVVGRSAAGSGGMGGILGIGGDGARRGGGVKVTYDGRRRPLSVEVKFLF